MTTILFVWTLVGAAGTQFMVYERHDWRPFGDFTTEAKCVAAAQQLNIEPKRFRCIAK